MKQRYFDRTPLYLTIDKYMSGGFWPLFRNTVLISLGIFVMLWFVAWLLTGWNMLEAFVQMTNPQAHSNPGDLNPPIWSREFGQVMEYAIIPIINLFGLVVLNGVILTLLVNWVSNRKDRHDKGESRYDYIFTRKYSVIIGGHKMVASLARDLMANDKNEYILIQTQRDPEAIRREIAAQITDDETAGRVIVYSGSRSSLHELKELNLGGAQEVYIVGEPSSIDGTSHDAINMLTWDLMNTLCHDERADRIPCHVMFEYQSTFSAFQFTDLKIEKSGAFRFIPFSIYENWAQQVLISRKSCGLPYYTPLDGVDGLQYSSVQRVHLIVVGMSKMGVALAIEAARIAHYPNFNNPAAGRPRTLITFIDRDARREMLFLMGRFRELFQLARWRYVKAPDDLVKNDDKAWTIYDTMNEMSSRKSDDEYRWHDPMHDDEDSPYYGGYLGEDFIDIDFEFIEGDSALPSVQNYITEACADAGSRTTLAVCLPVAAEAMSVALYFEPSVYERVQQIWVQQPESGALVEAVSLGLTGRNDAKFKSLRPFGIIDECDYLVRIHSMLPKIVAYSYDCMDRGTSLAIEYETTPLEELAKKINAFWLTISHDKGKSAVAKRWSNIYCSNTFETKMRSIDSGAADEKSICDTEALAQLARTEHNRWVIEQLLLGVRPAGKEFSGQLPIEDKDLRAKLKSRNIHPDLISNDMLGSTQAYDEGIVKIIPLALLIEKQNCQ